MAHAVSAAEARVKALERELEEARKQLASESREELAEVVLEERKQAAPDELAGQFTFTQKVLGVGFTAMTYLLPPVTGWMMLWARFYKDSLAAR